MSTDLEEPLEAPPSERAELNNLGDAFRSALAKQPPKPTAKAKAAPSKEQQPEPKPSSTTQAPEASEPELATPTPPAPEKPAEAPPVPELKGKARESWEKMEGVIKTTKAEAAALKAERDALREQLKNGGADAETKAKLTEAETVIRSFALAQSPQFHSYYQAKIADAVAQATEAAGDFGEELQEVFALPAGKVRDERIESIAQDLGEFQRAGIAAAYTQLRAVEREKQSELGKADANLKAMAEHHQSRQRQEQVQQMQNRALLLGHVSSRIDEEFSGMEPELATEAKNRTRNMIDGRLDAQGYADLLTDAARAKKAVVVEKELREHIAKLESQVEAMTSSNAPINGTGGSHPTKLRPGEQNNHDLGNKFRKAYAQQNGRAHLQTTYD